MYYQNVRSFSVTLLLWLQSFISNRHIIVKHQQFESDLLSISSGVPQGDHLSILLFNIYIDDLPDVVQYSQMFLFADDAKLVCTIRSLQDAINLQSDIMNLEKLAINNCLTINTQKCQFMRYNLIKTLILFNYSIFG